VRRLLNPKHEVTIGVVGKYIELQDAYKSVYESIAHAGIANTCKVNVRRIDAEDLEKSGGLSLLKGWTGSWSRADLATGERGQDRGRPLRPREGHSLLRPLPGPPDCSDRESRATFLSCRAQTALNSTPSAPIRHQHDGGAEGITDKGATMRLGSYDCAITPGTQAAKAYGQALVRERHRHRYEVNNAYLGRLKRALVVSGMNPRRNLVEIIELKAIPGSWRSSSTPSSSRSPIGAPAVRGVHSGGNPAQASRRARKGEEGPAAVSIFDPDRLLLIAGPCSLEGEGVCRAVADRLAALATPTRS